MARPIKDFDDVDRGFIESCLNAEHGAMQTARALTELRIVVAPATTPIKELLIAKDRVLVEMNRLRAEWVASENQPVGKPDIPSEYEPRRETAAGFDARRTVPQTGKPE